MTKLQLEVKLNQNRTVTMNWNPIEGAVSYYMDICEKEGRRELVRINNLTACSYTSTVQLEEGMSYVIYVAAKDKNNNWFTLDHKEVFVPRNLEARYNLTPPEIHRVTAYTNMIKVEWKESTYAEGYRILFQGTVTDMGTKREKIFYNLMEETTYTYAVQSYNRYAESSFSPSAAVTTPLSNLPEPKNPRSESGEGSVTLSWNPVSGADTYEIEFDGETFHQSGTSRTFSGLTAGTSYTWKVRGYNSRQEGRWSTEKTVWTLPPAPQNIRVDTTADTVEICWDPVPGIQFLRYCFSAYGSNEVVAPAANRLVLGGLRPETTYQFQLSFCNAGGQGVYSPVISVTTGQQTLAAPKIRTTDTTDSSITVGWSGIEGADAYEVECGGVIRTTAALSLTISGLTANQTYGLRIRAVNTSRTAASLYSEEVTVVTAPLPPADFYSSCAQTSIQLGWNAVEGAQGYEVLSVRAGSNSSSSRKVSGTETAFSGLDPFTEYSFQVRTKGRNGFSVYSRPETVRTLPILPDAIKNIRKEAGTDQVRIWWNTARNAEYYVVLFDGAVHETEVTEMIIDALSPGTAYTFQVYAKNSMGSGVYSEVMTVITAPLPPKNIRAECTSDSMTVYWEEASSAAGYTVRIGNRVIDAKGNSLTVTGLSSNTEYECRIAGYSEHGTGGYSEVYIFRTLPVDPAEVTGISKTSTEHTAVIRWNEVKDADGYVVLFDGTAHETEATEITIDGLSPGTVYTFQVYAKNSMGTEGSGREMTVTTAPLPPENIRAESTRDTVRIQWDAVEAADSYVLRFDGREIITEEIFAEITGLAPDTDYSYQVRADSVDGEGAYGSMQEIRTQPVLPGVVSNITWTATEHTITLNWEEASDAESYEIQWNRNVYRTEDTTYTFRNLGPFRKYTFVIYGVNTNGTGEGSEPVDTMTAPGYPSWIKAYAEGNQVTVSWRAVTGVTGYLVKLGSHEQVVPSGQTSCIFAGLDFCQTYYFQVSSLSEHGQSSYSPAQSVVTDLDEIHGLPVPENLCKMVSGTRAELSWDAVEGAGYYILKVISGEGAYIENVYGLRAVCEDLIPGEQYRFQVRARHVERGGSSFSPEVSIEVPPLPPQEISAEAGEHSMLVSWSAVEGAAGYQIRCGGEEYLAAPEETSCLFEGLVSNTEYSYQVCAMSVDGPGNAAGPESCRTSRSASGVLPAPGNVSFQAGSRTLTVRWDPVEGAGQYMLQIHGKIGVFPADQEEVVFLVEPNTSYHICIKAVSGQTGGEESVLEIVTPPRSPEQISMESTETGVTVSWERIEGATGYLLIVNGSEYLIDGGNTVSREIQGLSPGTLLSCQVASRNSYGTSQDPGTAEGRTTLHPPEGVSAQAGEESITVFWDPVEGATGYEICILEQCRMVGNPAAASCTMEGLTPGEYTYTIKTRNQGGCGSAAGGSVRILPPVPEVPEQVTCMVLDDMLVIEWPNVEWAETYKVLLQWADREEIQEGFATRKVVVDPERNTDYTFFVCACNVSGCSMFSQGQTVRTSSGIPPVPVGVVGQALSATVLELQWQWGYGKAEWYEVQVNGALYRTKESRFLMEGLTPDTLYECMVQAGNRYGVSSWSQKISVRTLLPAPENISCGISYATGILEWDPVPGADYYEIDFGGSVYEIDGCRLEISDLDQNTEYSYQIRGMRSDVDGEYSPMDSVRTRHLLAEQSLHVRASATRNSVLVSWDSLPEAVSYIVEFDGLQIPKAAPGQEEEPAARMLQQIKVMASGDTEERERLHHRFSGLLPDTLHSYRVRAVDAYGAAPFSSMQSIRTREPDWGSLPEGGWEMNAPDGRMFQTALDPVDPLTGAFLWSRTCLQEYGRDGLCFVLMYHSLEEGSSQGLSAGWHHALDYRLVESDTGIYFHTPSGGVIAFGRDEDVCVTEKTAPGYAVERLEDGRLMVTDRTGAGYVFDSDSHLTEIRRWGKEGYCFSRDEKGRLQQIRGHYGAVMELSYTGDRLTGVALSGAEPLTLSWQEDHLVSLTGAGLSMAFGYDDSGQLYQLKESGMVLLENSYDSAHRVCAQMQAGRGTSLVSYGEDTGEGSTTLVTDPKGYVTTYTYDRMGRLEEVSLEEGRIRRSYNVSGQLTEEQDALGNIRQMSYDSMGRMHSITYPDGSSETVVYNDRNQPLEVTARDGSTAGYTYDEEGRLVSFRDALGALCSYGYDEAGNLCSYTDREGNLWKYVHDEEGHLQESVDPAGGVYRYSRDSLGRLEEHVLPEGSTTRYTYDGRGLLTVLEDGAGQQTFTYDDRGCPTGYRDRRGSLWGLVTDAWGRVVEMTDPEAHTWKYGYDSTGNLCLEEDPLGNRTSYTRNASGLVTGLEDACGSRSSYRYDKAGRMSGMTDPAGGIHAWTHDSEGQPLSYTDPMGRTTRYTYDAMGRMTGEEDALGQTTSRTYDACGNLVRLVDAAGQETCYTYDREYRLKTLERAGKTWTFEYDSLGRLVTLEDPEGRVESRSYDLEGRLVFLAGADGSTRTFRYDRAGRVIRTEEADGSTTDYTYDGEGCLTEMADAGGYTSRYSYDRCGRLTEMVDGTGSRVRRTYDETGRLVTLEDPAGGVYTFAYDACGRLLEAQDPLGGVTGYRYDSRGYLVERRDPEGYTTSWTYDACGNPLTCRDGAGHTRTFLYDSLDRLIQAQTEDGSTMRWTYTPLGQVASVTDPEGAITCYSYDELGYLTEIRDGLDHSTRFTRDSAGRILTMEDAAGQGWEYSYDSAGRMCLVRDPEGNQTSYRHDAMGRLTEIRDGESRSLYYGYDALGRLVSFRDGGGAEIRFTHDGAGRITSVTDAVGSVTQYVYDACGNLVRVWDAAGYSVCFEYDALGRVIREYERGAMGDEGGVTVYSYDRRGYLVRRKNPSGAEKSWSYDGLGRPLWEMDEEGCFTSFTYGSHAGPLSMNCSDGRQAMFRYDRRGQLVEMEDWTGCTSLEYDVLGRLTHATDPRGYVTEYRYDALGRVEGVTGPGGRGYSLSYTPSGNIREAVHPEDSTARIRYRYDRGGVLCGASLPGLEAALSMDRGGRISGYRLEDHAGNLLLQGHRNYDPCGRLEGDWQEGLPSLSGGEILYRYDAQGRLSGWETPETVESYMYDQLGNRIRRDWRREGQEPVTETSTYNLSRQLLSCAGTSYTYDWRGNLTGESGSRNLQYVYDSLGRLAAGRNLDTGAESRYIYNALGMRMAREEQLPGETGGYTIRRTEYVPDWMDPAGRDLFRYCPGSGSLTRIPGPDGGCAGLILEPDRGSAFPEADPAGAQTAWTVPGGRAGMLAVSDGSGTPLCGGRRNPWGPLAEAPEGWLEEALGFGSYVRDNVTGAYFAHARFYDSGNGRMMQPDPVWNGINPYLYCRNDPVNLADPDGRIPLAPLLLGGLAGFAERFVESSLEQRLDGRQLDMKQAIGSGIREGIMGLAEGALGLAGAGKFLTAAGSLVAGLAGDALGQLASTGSVDWKDSLEHGISRSVTGGILGRGSSAAKRSTRELAARHAGAGAAGEVVRQLFEDPAGSYQVSRTGTRQTRTAVETMVPVVYPVETMGCGPSSPLNRNLGYYKTVGYRYMEEPFTETTTVQGKTPGLLERAAGVAMAGLSSAVFGGVLPEMTRRQDAALGAVSGSVLG